MKQSSIAANGRWQFLSVAAAIVFVVSMAVPEDAFAVAGFTRQTGMNCNSCHTLHGGPTPNFTFTGKKFNALGYRLPKGTHTVLSETREQGGSEDESKGEYLKILPTTLSGRFQYQVINTSERPGADDWGPVRTNPTSRFALFPFTGPIGDHWGVWTEIYIVPFTSDDNEWGIADVSYEEFDFRYIINPENDSSIFGFALTNQGINQLFGFGPYPGLPSYLSRGGVGGYAHPNRAQLYHYGWVNDRFVYAIGAGTGDTNDNWDDANVVGIFGWAIRNRNDNEMWLNFTMRTGNDALPLVSASGAEDSSRSWQYRDAVGGIDDTRLAGLPVGSTCADVPGAFAGRRNTGGCAYLAEELDDFTTFNVELRWAAQNVDKFFGTRSVGNWSFEHVARLAFNDEDYYDGASAKRNSWGLSTVIGYKHTWYFKPRITGDIDYEFTDNLGTVYDIDTPMRWSFRVAYKPVENFLFYAQFANSQSIAITRDALTGRSFSLTADISF